MIADEERGAVGRRAGIGWWGPGNSSGGGFGLARCEVGEEGVTEVGAGRVAGEHRRMVVRGGCLNNKQEGGSGI